MCVHIDQGNSSGIVGITSSSLPVCFFYRGHNLCLYYTDDIGRLFQMINSSSVFSQAHLSPTPTCATPGATLLPRKAWTPKLAGYLDFAAPPSTRNPVPLLLLGNGGLIFTFRSPPRTTYGKTTS